MVRAAIKAVDFHFVVLELSWREEEQKKKCEGKYELYLQM
jgi:hypothetical protein